jgi:anaphase-promoting complex subunit 1
VDPKDIQAFLSDTRSPFQTLVHIHHTPRDRSPAILRTFKLKLDSEATAYSVELVEAVECLSAIPIISTRVQINDALMLSSAGDLQLLTSDCRTIAVAAPGGRRVIQLSDPVGSEFTATFKDGSRSRCAVDGRLKDNTSLACFEILSLFISPQDFFNLKVELTTRKANSWTAFEEVLQAVLGLSLDSQEPVRPLDRLTNQSSSSVDPLRRRLACLRPNYGTAMTRSRTLLECEQFSQNNRAACLLALHLLAEDCRLDSVRETQLSKLIPLIARLANALRRPEWTDHWMRLYPLSVAGIAPVKCES